VAYVVTAAQAHRVAPFYNFSSIRAEPARSIAWVWEAA
jgi:hypothetical protein